MTRSYAWPLTVGPGVNLNLHVSTEHPRFGVRLFRYGATITPVPGPATIYDGYDLPLGRPDEAWGWPRYVIPLDAALDDGVYLAVPVPVTADGEIGPVTAGPEVAIRRDASLLIVKRKPTRPILVKLPTATYAAYNQLGGASTYAAAFWVRDWAAQGYVASLQRPGNGGVGGRVMEGDAPDPYARASRRQVFAHWDAPFVAWLEGHGYDVSYCTDFDLHFDEGLLDGVGLDGPKLLLSAGHDEYWSERMRQRVLEFVDAGGSMCFFAGDVACFQIEYSAAGDRLFTPKMAGESPEVASRLTGALWHVHDPQDWLTLNSGAFGGGWWDGRRSIEAYQPVVADHWIFDGVDVPPDGISGGPDTPVIGYETDGVRLKRASDPPVLSEHRKGASGGRTLLAVGKLSAGWVAGYEQANAAIVIRTAQSGGMTFSVGTTDWPLGLADPAVSQVTANVIDRLSCCPLRIRGPVCGQGEYIGEGEMVGAGQQASWYVDGAQLADLSDLSWKVTGGAAAPGSSPAHITTTCADGDAYLTVTATATDAQGRAYFGSRTVRVAGAEEYLRRRIIRALDALAFPDEQGGALVDQGESESELADRVIPVRLGWIKEYAGKLTALVAELEDRWTGTGRMADASLRPDEK
ncbi:MAG TPA: N,N-dimethylformamidase beta subunit family domain-containing protein [Streptosporangiaceae bacterium]|nr:N,N-dimethylformamidase beta subunit family domain-containing protein [Streptosporangiaceae bacterium]